MMMVVTTRCTPPPILLKLTLNFNKNHPIQSLNKFLVFGSSTKNKPRRRSINHCLIAYAYPPEKPSANTNTNTNSNTNSDSSFWVKGCLWACEAVYVVWLFLLPYAPGDPVWRISSETVNSLVALSLNFFLILPLLHVEWAPPQHPMSEGLFNFVIGWTFMFAPLLFTDRRGRSFRGLDLLWGLQMFLTNTVLIPYMAIRLNKKSKKKSHKYSLVASLMVRGSTLVGLTGASVCLASLLWGLFGRPEFGDIAQRCQFLTTYVASERLAYAFLWDICLYAVFQPWLIADNLHQSKVPQLLRSLRFLPVVGLLAYLLSLKPHTDDLT